jgi:hypothetical protein
MGTAMTPIERDQHWLEIEHELAEIAAGKVTHGTDPAASEAILSIPVGP